MVILREMGSKVPKLVNSAQISPCRPLIRPLVHKRVMLEGPESLKRPHKLVLPENVSKSAFYTVILGEIGLKVGKLVNLVQISTRPLIRPLIHQQVMLQGPYYLKSPHKLILPENVSKSAFYMVILGEMSPKVPNLVNSAKI